MCVYALERRSCGNWDWAGDNTTYLDSGAFWGRRVLIDIGLVMLRHGRPGSFVSRVRGGVGAWYISITFFRIFVFAVGALIEARFFQDVRLFKSFYLTRASTFNVHPFDMACSKMHVPV